MDELTVDQAQSAFKTGKYTSRQLVEHYLERIKTFDRNGPQINSTLAISSIAIEEAERLDAHLKETSSLIGPLHGIPILVKDQADTKGIVTTYGSKIFKDNIPDEDATLVKKLKAAGAIIIAKTALPDWATSFHSTSTVSGVTKNPYDLERDPGGSSCGTGAGIAADFAILGLGEDTGGSIRLPSSFCGLVGLRPSIGLISRAGLAPLVACQDTPGPMCRTVRDAALMLDAMVGFDSADPYSTTAVVAGPPRGGSYAANLSPDKIKGARLGVLRECFGPDSDPDCRAVNDTMNSALEALQKAGATVVDVTIPDLQHFCIASSVYTLRSRNDIDKFLAKKQPGLTCKRIMDEKLYHPNLELLEAIAAGPEDPLKEPEYGRALEVYGELQRLTMSIMASNNLDAIVFPDCKIPAPRLSDVMAMRWKALEFPTNTLLASQARLPAISVPVGLTESGLPVGMEMMGMIYQEQHLLELAFGVETWTNARKGPRI